MAEVDLKTIEANIVMCEANLEDAEIRVADIEAHLVHLKNVRYDLLLVKTGLKVGDKLLMTKAAWESADSMYFHTGDICIFSRRHKRENNLVFVEKYHNGRVCASCLIPFQNVIDMKVAYKASVEAQVDEQ